MNIVLRDADTTKFWKNVNKDSNNILHFPELSPCWEWTGLTYQDNGYGRFAPHQFEDYRAHVYSWTLHNGPVPKGLKVLHHCDNPPCVRPTHLFLGTMLDNTIDAIAKGRHNWQLYPESKPHGATHHDAKLTDDQVRLIREMYDSKKYTLKEIANQFPISLQMVWYIGKRKKWKSVA